MKDKKTVQILSALFAFLGLVLLGYVLGTLLFPGTDSDQEVAVDRNKKVCEYLFDEFIVEETEYVEPVLVDYTNSSFEIPKEAQTYLDEGIKEGTPFADSYVFTEWGCGTSCQISAILNPANGDIVMFGLQSTVGFKTQPNSSLLIVNPKEYVEKELALPEAISKNLDTEYYEMTDSGLKFLCSVNHAQKSGSACIQVIAEAFNMSTNETISFSTPCSVPKLNWSIRKN